MRTSAIAFYYFLYYTCITKGFLLSSEAIGAALSLTEGLLFCLFCFKIPANKFNFLIMKFY